MNIENAINLPRHLRTVVQIVESETCVILRELDATNQDPETVAECAMRNLNPFRYFTRVVSPVAPTALHA